MKPGTVLKVIESNLSKLTYQNQLTFSNLLFFCEKELIIYAEYVTDTENHLRNKGLSEMST